ncbi:ALG8 [Lepeophtheirus salmonis]|uniref:Alpha-1,3-glucosyltransferase n=1 Tax=Lepeophtheirus salmonis TaxID=72036 RepID=A0A7R8D7B0_LEPSM|nr:ALG8 [Lepeophtheirus salmonis]CAF3025580.1 ALG8 [Lepeophtheirus salmonis]
MSTTEGAPTAAERRQQAIRAKILRNKDNRLGHVLGNVSRDEINTGTGNEELEPVRMRATPLRRIQDEAVTPVPLSTPPPSIFNLSGNNQVAPGVEAPTVNERLICCGWLLSGLLTRLLLHFFPNLNAFIIFSITAFSVQTLRLIDLRASSNSNVSLLRLAGLIFLDSRTNDKVCSFIQIMPNAGLLLVDHIHFQYNGFLFGLLFLSMGYAKNEQLLASGFWFAVLCNFKHIFAYTAPAYVVYLFGTYCFQSGHFKLDKLLILGLTVISVCVMSFGPFIYFGQFATVLLRLFPFKRGLVHAYWAPNFWALYNFLDKTISVILRVPTKASMTGGLVQEYSHTTLPSIPPSVTLIATLIFMMPCLWKLWKNVNHNRFLGAIVLCSWSSFLFGWHVHEKAILLIILPLALLAYSDRSYSKIYFITSVVGHFSLFPLLFESREIWIKLLVFLCHAAYTYNSLLSTSNKIGKRAAIKNSLSPLEKLYLLVHTNFYP